MTKQNGVYINSFDNHNHNHFDYKMEKDYGKKNGRDLRRVASEYNVNNNEEGFGFSVRGDAPVIIAGVEPNSLADVSYKYFLNFMKVFIQASFQKLIHFCLYLNLH